MATKSKKKAKASKELTLRNDVGLTTGEMEAANKLISNLPVQVKAYRDYREAEGVTVSRFFTLVDSLRAPVVLQGPAGPLPAAKLNGRELQLLLQGLGERKQRVTEFKRVVEMEEEEYQRARKANLTKLETLALARGSIELEEGEDGTLSVKKAEAEAKKDPVTPHKAKFHRLHKEFSEALHQLLAEHSHAPKAVKDDVPYELEGMTADGREYLVHVFVDAIPTKPE